MARGAYALAIFVVFGGLAVVMARSLRDDYRRARARDRPTGGHGERSFDLLMSTGGWWAVVLCSVVAVGGATLVLMS